MPEKYVPARKLGPQGWEGSRGELPDVDIPSQVLNAVATEEERETAGVHETEVATTAEPMNEDSATAQQRPITVWVPPNAWVNGARPC